MMTSQISPHTPCEDSRATDRAECAQDTNHPHRTVPNSGSHHAERDGYVGQEPPLTVGNDTFYVDPLFFHRRRFSPPRPGLAGRGAGGEGFFAHRLEERQIQTESCRQVPVLPCRSRRATPPATRESQHRSGPVQISRQDPSPPRPDRRRLKKTGFATYQTALPDERLIQRRLEQLPNPSETDE